MAPKKTSNKRSYELNPYTCTNDRFEYAVRNPHSKKYFRVDVNHPSYTVEQIADQAGVGCEILREKLKNFDMISAVCMMEGSFAMTASGTTSNRRERTTTVYKFDDKWTATLADAVTLAVQKMLNYDPETNKFDLTEWTPNEPIDPDKLYELASVVKEIEFFSRCTRAPMLRVVPTIEKPDWIDACLAAKAEAETEA
jgi:hypothetical protein